MVTVTVVPDVTVNIPEVIVSDFASKSAVVVKSERIIAFVVAVGTPFDQVPFS